MGRIAKYTSIGLAGTALMLSSMYLSPQPRNDKFHRSGLEQIEPATNSIQTRNNLTGAGILAGTLMMLYSAGQMIRFPNISRIPKP